MIKIFNVSDKDFTSAGEIIINPLKCVETKKKSLNGWYIDVEVSIKYNEYIEKDKICVIKTKSKLNLQGFRISENIERTAKKVKFRANHVMFDAEDYILEDVRVIEQNGINALNYINVRTNDRTPFSFYSNVENINTAYFVRKNLLEAMGTIEERWNGFFDADNWNISFLTSVGNDNGESIIYGKDLQSFKIYEDWSNVVTKLLPVGYDGLLLPEIYLNSDIQYEKSYTKVVSFETDLDVTTATTEELTLELREKAERYLQDNKYPRFSYTVVSNINNRLEIGDIIHILHPIVEIKTEVIVYEYDTIKEQINTLNFGNFNRDIKTKFDNIKNSIEKISQIVSKQENIIKNQSDLINTLNKNGCVYIDDNEILILDELPKESAKNVWRFGLGGFGFSSNGYEGPFETAISMDGSINAKFITSGMMSTDRIEGLGEQLSLIVQSSTNNSELTENLSKEIEELKITTSGLQNTLEKQGGSNLLLNSSGLFDNEYWEGTIKSITNTDIQNNYIAKACFCLQNGSMKQIINVVNGSYYIGFKYQKILELANCKIFINGNEIELTNTNLTEFEQYIDVSEHSITIEIVSDSDNACLIGDIIVVQGSKQSWSSNMNEIYTSTVKIGIGLEITSNTMKTKLLANADGVRIVNVVSGTVATEFTDKGTITNELQANSAKIAGVLIQQVGRQTLFSSLL